MKLKFIWATKKVTWSKIYFEYNHKKFLVDYWMEQEGKNKLEIYKNNLNLNNIIPKEIDYIILTHSHIDHSGLIPYLVKKWFRWKILTEKANKKILKALWEDSCNIAMKDYEYLVTKKWISKKVIEPLYSETDIRQSIKLLELVDYKKVFYPFENKKDTYITFYNAWHILGSAYVVFNYKEEKKVKTVCFSGDLWRKDSFILINKEYIDNANTIILESTYWDKEHENLESQINAFWKHIKKTINRWWKVIIPSFALDRTQNLLYILNKLKNTWKIDKNIPIYLDTPLGIKITNIYEWNLEYFKAKVVEEWLNSDKKLFYPDKLREVEKTNTSMILTKDNTPSIIIAASWMADNWRVIFHLEEQIQNPKNLVLFVWYTVEGSLGNRLLKNMWELKNKYVSINWNSKALKAEIQKCTFSSHADRKELLNFCKRNIHLENIYLQHWWDRQKKELKKYLESNLKKVNIEIVSSNQYYKV